MPKRIKVTYNADYHGKPIMTDKLKQQGCLTSQLQSIDERFDDMTDRHNKVFFMRLDIRFPDAMHAPADNQLIRAFNADFNKALTRDGIDAHYVMVREQSRAKHQHYHGVLLLDGSKTQNITKHIDTAERIWRMKLGLSAINPQDQDVPPEAQRRTRGLIDDCTTDREGQPQENGVMLRRDDPQYEAKINRCFRRASYLAKENQKSNNPESHRQLFASRIKKKNT